MASVDGLLLDFTIVTDIITFCATSPTPFFFFLA
jgi:hypothetical protein